MDTFEEILQAVQDDLSVDDSSSLFPEALVKRVINRAYRKAGGLFRWTELEDAKKTSTVANQEYYDYPDNWYPDSIWRVEVDGNQYGEDPDGSPMNFRDYTIWKADSANDDSTSKKWSTQWRRFFLNPIPTTSGNNNISVWGTRVVESLTNDSDTTIFSYSMPEGNEAVVLEAVAILKSKGEEEDRSAFRSAEAKQILALAWKRVQAEQDKYEKTQPMLEVTDMFGNNATKKENNIGNF